MPRLAPRRGSQRQRTSDASTFLKRVQTHTTFRSHRQHAGLKCATTAAGAIAGGGGGHHRESGTDRTTTTRVSSSAGANPPPRLSSSFLFPSSSFFRSCVWSRASKAPGGLSPSPFPPSQTPDAPLAYRHLDAAKISISCATRPGKCAFIST